MNLQVFTALVAILFNLFLGSFVFLRDRNKPVNIFYGLLCVCLAIWASSDILVSIFPAPNIALLSVRFSYIGAIFAPIVILNLFYALTKEGKNKDQIILIPLYLLTFFLFFLNFTQFLIKDVSVNPFKEFPGSLYSLFVLLFFGGFLFGLTKLFVVHKKLQGIEKRQISYVIWSTILSLIAVSIYSLTIYKVEIPPIYYLIEIIYLSTVAYAILKHNLMDIRVIIGRNAAYGIAGFLLATSFVGLNSLQMPMWLAMTTNVLLALFWAFATHRLRDIIQTPIDKWISWYKPEVLLNSIVKELGLASERDQAVKIVATQLQNSIKIKKVNILLGRKDGDPEPFEYVLLEEGDGYLKPLLSDHPFIANFRNLPVGQAGAIHYNKLPSKIRESIKELIFLRDRLYLPLFSADGLEGIIILGQKVSEDPYDKKDFTFFDTLTIQIKSFLDRIRPYEKVKKDFENSQKKLYDTERQLEQSQRLAALGTVAAGVAHEIRNPLGMIQLTATSLTRDEVSTDSGLKAFKQDINQNVKRIINIMQNMLSLAKSNLNIRKEVDINQIIEEVLQFFVINNIKLTKALNPLPKFKANQEELKQIFINLVDNAMHAMPDGGELTISTAHDKKNISIRVSDTGKGIAPDDLPKIFDPFFSTRHEGAGLGLSIVYRIVREHGGTIEVTSDKGKGTSFLIVFPF